MGVRVLSAVNSGIAFMTYAILVVVQLYETILHSLPFTPFVPLTPLVCPFAWVPLVGLSPFSQGHMVTPVALQLLKRPPNISATRVMRNFRDTLFRSWDIAVRKEKKYLHVSQVKTVKAQTSKLAKSAAES